MLGCFRYPRAMRRSSSSFSSFSSFSSGGWPLVLMSLSLACKNEGTQAPPSTRSSASATGSVSASTPGHAAQKCPADDLASCGPDGCAEPGSPHALFNRHKRRATSASGEPVTFDSAIPVTHRVLQKLQARASQLVGQKKELSPSERAKIASLVIDDLALGEGAPVRLAGFLAPHQGSNASGVHPGGVESVNCQLKTEEWKDIHIPVLAQVGDDECHGVVAEMIPQGRDQHPSWTTAALRQLGTNKRVLFVGPLFYDNEHDVHDDCSATGTQPKRMSLWEVHPVTELWICDTGQCEATNKAGWRKLE